MLLFERRWHETREARVAFAGVEAAVLAPAEGYRCARAALFSQGGFDEQYIEEFLKTDHDLGEAGRFELHDPTGETKDRLVIRMEILEVIESARRELATATAEVVDPSQETRPDRGWIARGLHAIGSRKPQKVRPPRGEEG